MSDDRKDVMKSIRHGADRAAKKGDPQFALCLIQQHMGCVGISQCALDVADEAIKRLNRLTALEAERDKLREALKDALDEIFTLYAWSDQVGLYDIEEEPVVVKARAALAETEDKTND